MPMTKRDLIKRKIDQISTHIDTILVYIRELLPIYQEGYPLHTEILTAFAQGIIACEELLQEFRKIM